MNYNTLKDLFQQLTDKTYTSKEVSQLDPILTQYGFDCVDYLENYKLVIGESKTIFAAHLDTAAAICQDVKHVWDGRYFSTSGKTILGADDKAGVALILSMVEDKIPGTYYLFNEEESGGGGSSHVADKMAANEYDRMICFDRKGYSSIISKQFGGRCASKKFVQELSNMFARVGMFLNEDDGGTFTDSANFTHLISECTNISVGYFNQHTQSEYQDLHFLYFLANAVKEIDWEMLGSYRELSQRYERSYGRYGSSYGNGYGYGAGFGYGRGSSHRTFGTSTKRHNLDAWDDWDYDANDEDKWEWKDGVWTKTPYKNTKQDTITGWSDVEDTMGGDWKNKYYQTEFTDAELDKMKTCNCDKYHLYVTEDYLGSVGDIYEVGCDFCGEVFGTYDASGKMLHPGTILDFVEERWDDDEDLDCEIEYSDETTMLNDMMEDDDVPFTHIS